MVNVESKDPAWLAAQEKMAELLRDATELWGPRLCSHGDWDECEDCEFSDTRPDPSKVLSEFLIIGLFVSMNDGTASIVQITPPNQLFHHTLGLVEAWKEW